MAVPWNGMAAAELVGFILPIQVGSTRLEMSPDRHRMVVHSRRYNGNERNLGRNYAMALKDFLVVVDDTPASAVRLDLAARLATRCDAHLTALYAFTDMMFPGYIEAEIPQELRESRRQSRKDQTDRMAAAFDDAMRHHGLTDRSLALGDLFARLRLQRFVDDSKQRVVLPQAHAERDGQDDCADDQAAAQLVEVVHEAEPVLVADRANRAGHGLHEPTTVLFWPLGLRPAGLSDRRSSRPRTDRSSTELKAQVPEVDDGREP